MWINPVYIFRALQLLFAIIILGLDGYVASWYNTSASQEDVPASISFLIFTAVFVMLIVIPYTVLAPRYFPGVTNQYVMLGSEITTAVLWFCGFIASANMLRELATCRGMVCDSARGGTVLGAFECILFSGTAYLAVRHVFGRGDDGRETRKLEMHNGWIGKDDSRV